MRNLPPGYVHGRLTVLAFEPNPADPKHPKYRCRCTCGREKSIGVWAMKRTHSCGCIKVEMLKAKATHGMSNTPEFKRWADMIARCSKSSRADFERYGGRGVTVCQRWLDSFAAFYADMGPRPSPKHSIDRINNDQGYTPENCRWATATEQRVNQRRVTLIDHEGLSLTLKEWSRRLGLNYDTLKRRRRANWPLPQLFRQASRLRLRR